MPNGIVSTDKAPKAIGPYSQAVIAGDLIFTSGQIPLDPATQQLVQGDIRVQTERLGQAGAQDAALLRGLVEGELVALGLDSYP